jgi:predicted dehydrogenase
MKIAVIGTGFGNRVVAPIYWQLGFEVEVTSPRDESAVKRACYSDVDMVSVHSPPFLHHQHVQWALDRGHAVLCDKPFGRCAAEARAMRDRAAEVGVLNFLNFEFRRFPSRMKVKALLDAGAIGSLQHISWSWIGNVLRPQKFRWLYDRDLAGGWLGAFGSHAIDTIRWFFGSELSECGGIMRTETPARLDHEGLTRNVTTEDAFTAWFRTSDGRTASLDTAFSTPVALPQRMILLGETGSLEIVDEFTVILRRSGQAPEQFDFPLPAGDPHEPGIVPWLTEVGGALRAGRQISPSFADGVAVAEVMTELRAKASLLNSNLSDS